MRFIVYAYCLLGLGAESSAIVALRDAEGCKWATGGVRDGMQRSGLVFNLLSPRLIEMNDANAIKGSMDCGSERRSRAVEYIHMLL